MGGNSGFPVSRRTASPGGVMAFIEALFKQRVTCRGWISTGRRPILFL